MPEELDGPETIPEFEKLEAEWRSRIGDFKRRFGSEEGTGPLARPELVGSKKVPEDPGRLRAGMFAEIDRLWKEEKAALLRSLEDAKAEIEALRVLKQSEQNALRESFTREAEDLKKRLTEENRLEAEEAARKAREEAEGRLQKDFEKRLEDIRGALLAEKEKALDELRRALAEEKAREAAREGERARAEVEEASRSRLADKMAQAQQEWQAEKERELSGLRSDLDLEMSRQRCAILAEKGKEVEGALSRAREEYAKSLAQARREWEAEKEKELVGIRETLLEQGKREAATAARLAAEEASAAVKGESIRRMDEVRQRWEAAKEKELEDLRASQERKLEEVRSRLLEERRREADEAVRKLREEAALEFARILSRRLEEARQEWEAAKGKELSELQARYTQEKARDLEALREQQALELARRQEENARLLAVVREEWTHQKGAELAALRARILEEKNKEFAAMRAAQEIALEELRRNLTEEARHQSEKAAGKARLEAALDLTVEYDRKLAEARRESAASQAKELEGLKASKARELEEVRSGIAEEKKRIAEESAQRARLQSEAEMKEIFAHEMIAALGGWQAQKEKEVADLKAARDRELDEVQARLSEKKGREAAEAAKLAREKTELELRKEFARAMTEARRGWESAKEREVTELKAARDRELDEARARLSEKKGREAAEAAGLAREKAELELRKEFDRAMTETRREWEAAKIKEMAALKEEEAARLRDRFREVEEDIAKAHKDAQRMLEEKDREFALRLGMEILKLKESFSAEKELEVKAAVQKTRTEIEQEMDKEVARRFDRVQADWQLQKEQKLAELKQRILDERQAAAEEAVRQAKGQTELVLHNEYDQRLAVLQQEWEARKAGEMLELRRQLMERGTGAPAESQALKPPAPVSIEQGNALPEEVLPGVPQRGGGDMPEAAPEPQAGKTSAEEQKTGGLLGRSLDEALLKSGLVDEDQLQTAQAVAQKYKKDIVSALLSLNFCEEGRLLELVCSVRHIPYYGSLAGKVPVDAGDWLDGVTCWRYNVIALGRTENTLTLALSNPLDLHALDAVSNLTGCQIEPAIAPRQSIQEAIMRIHPTPTSSKPSKAGPAAKKTRKI